MSGTGAAGASGAAGGSATCTPGSVTCRDNFVVRCNESGRQRSERACPFVCRDGACAGNCIPGEQRCSGSMRQRCDDAGNWMTLETCRNACTPGACTDTCADGTRQCDGNTVTICRAGRQIDVQRCEYVCRDGACAGSCTPGNRQCRDNAVVTCSAEGAWGMPVACVNACIGAACSGECAPGAQRCGSNTSYQVCNGRGQWSGNVECRDQACVEGECSGECSPGDARCEGPTALSTCGADGQWGAPNECPDQACNDDRCDGACAPDSRRCDPEDPSQTQRCAPEGEWRDGPRCAPAEACLDGACTGVCAPGTRRCTPGNSASFQVCGDAGEWGPPVACGDGVSCGGDGTCGEDACATGQLPEWFGMNSGVDRSLDDPRWGGALDRFANGSGEMMPAAYAVVYDQESSTLAVTIRALGSDMPTPDDFVYFGVSSGAGTDGVAVRIELAMPGSEPDPRPLPSIATYRLEANAWSETGGRRDFVSGVSAWLLSDELAWAVSFHLDVRAAGLDPASPVRMAVGMRVENNAGPMASLTPSSLDVTDPLGQRAQVWPIVNLSAIECTGRVLLP